MNIKLTIEVKNLLLDLDISEINELIQYISDERDEREVHELQHEAETQEYYALQDKETENGI